MPPKPFLDHCRPDVIRPMQHGRVQLASTDVWLCSWLSSQLHNAANSAWIFRFSFGVAPCLLLHPPAIAAARSIAIGLSVTVSHHVQNGLIVHNVLNVHPTNHAQVYRVVT